MPLKQNKQTVSPLKIWRVSRNLSQLEAAMELGFSNPSQYQKMEWGSNLPRWGFLQELERRTKQPGLAAAYVVWFFDISADQLRSILGHLETSGLDIQLRAPAP